MDLSSRTYVGYAVSIKSEKDAYHKALDMISDMRIDLRSVKEIQIIRRFKEDPMTYLKEYFRRNASESGFSSDKRFLGGIMTRRRADRIEVSGFCKGLIHNLMLMNG